MADLRERLDKILAPLRLLNVGEGHAAVKTVKLLAQSTGEFTREELKKDVKLSWTDKAKAEIAAAKGGESSHTDPTDNSGGGGGTNTNSSNGTNGGDTGGNTGGNEGGGGDNNGGGGSGGGSFDTGS